MNANSKTEVKLVAFLNRLPEAQRVRIKAAMPDFEKVMVTRVGIEMKDLKADDKAHTISGYITTRDVDRVGDIVVPEGGDFELYKQNPVVLVGHDYGSLPVGKVTEIKGDDYGVRSTIEIAGTDAGKDIWKLVKGGFLRAFSIGFRATKTLSDGEEGFKARVDAVKEKWAELKERAGEVRRFIESWSLLELSIVPVPCNGQALIDAVSKGEIQVSADLLKRMDCEYHKQAPAVGAAVEPGPVVVKSAPMITVRPVVFVRRVEMPQADMQAVISRAVKKELDKMRGRLT